MAVELAKASATEVDDAGGWNSRDGDYAQHAYIYYQMARFADRPDAVLLRCRGSSCMLLS